MVTGECIRKWIGISYLMVLYMGEHDTKELAYLKMTIFKYFNPSIFYKVKKAKFSTKFAEGYTVTWMRGAEISEYQEI